MRVDVTNILVYEVDRFFFRQINVEVRLVFLFVKCLTIRKYGYRSIHQTAMEIYSSRIGFSII